MTTPRLDPRLGTDLGSYHLESVVGRGGMGVVYRATDTALDRPVAIKLIAPLAADDEAFRARFLRESKMAAAIDHPNIIPIYEAGERDGSYFLAMRFVDGTDLERRLRQGPLEPRAAVALLGQIASALDAAHAAGLVHRDVKPANVLVASGQGADRSDHAYLTDFGLTKQSGSETGLTRAGGFVGTLEYIAPEQIEGKPADGRADQYALAGIAVACLTGQVPFPRDSDVAIINAHLHDAPPSLHGRLASLPVAVDAVIARAMAKAPDDRYPDCRSFVEDLAWALGVTATRPRTGAGGGRTRDRRPLAVAAAVLGLGALAVVAVALISAGSGTPAASPSPSGIAGTTTSAQPPALPTPSADASAFPTSFEQAALALVPEAIRGSCIRGAGLHDSAAAGFVGKVPLTLGGTTPDLVNIAPTVPTASLTCSPASGASRVHFLWYQIASGIKGRDNTYDYLSLLAPRYGATEGDCSKDERALSSWSNERLGSGLVICFRTAPFDGSPWLDWTFANGHMLALATRDDRDYDALYDWFDGLRTFLP